MGGGEVGAREGLQAREAGGDVLPGLGQQVRAEGLEQPGAGIGGGAAAEADDDLAGAGADRVADQLAEPAG